MEFNILTTLLIVTLLFIIGTLPSGRIRFYTKSESLVLNIFFSNLFSAVFAVLIFATIKSHFNSIFLLLLFPICIFYFSQKPIIIKIQTKEFLKNILCLLPMVLFTTFLTYIYILPRTIEADVTYYSKIASYLNEKGTENYYHYYNDLLKGNLGLMPYHYFELWFTSLLQPFTGLTSILILKFIVYPYLIIILLTGLLGLYEHFTLKKNNAILPIITLLLSLLIGYFGQLISIKCSGWDILLSIWTRPNFILYCMGLILILLSLKDHNYYLLTASSILICLFSVTAIPAVLSAFFLYISYNFFTKQLKFKESLIYSSLVVIFAICYFLFYYFNGGDFSLIESKPITGIIAVAFKIWKATVGTFLNITTRCLAFVLLFLYLHKKGFLSTGILTYFVILTITSVGAFQLLSQLDNSYQIPHLAFCMLSLLLILSSLYFLRNAKNIIQFSIMLPILYLTYANNKHLLISKDSFWDNRAFFAMQKGLSPDFLKQVAAKLESEKGVCGFYMDGEKLKKTELRYRTELTLQPILELAYYTNKGNMVCLNTKEQILDGEGRGKEILEVWYKSFPDFCNESDPFVFLQKGKINSLLISEKDYSRLKDSSLNISLNKIEESKEKKWLLFSK